MRLTTSEVLTIISALSAREDALTIMCARQPDRTDLKKWSRKHTRLRKKLEAVDFVTVRATE